MSVSFVKFDHIHANAYLIVGFFASCFFFLFQLILHQNLQWARDVLLGSSVQWQQLKHMPAQGLFCERNKTNLFNVSLISHAPTSVIKTLIIHF